MFGPIKIGVLGAANIATRSVIPAIKSLPNLFTLVGTASRDLIRAKKIAFEFKSKAFHTYQSIIDKSLVDAVYIPLPNALHYEWVKFALQNGVHVLVEKSLGCSLAEVLDLNEIAAQNKLALIENFQFRFHRQLKTIQDLIDSGRIGKIRCLRSSFGFPPFKEENNIRYSNILGGGALLDAGAYTVKVSQILLGLGLEVKAASMNKVNGQEVDIWGGAYLQNPRNGNFAELAFGFDHYYQCGIEIWGSLGKLSTNRLFTAPLNYEPQIELDSTEGKEFVKVLPDDHFQNMLKHFYNTIQFGTELEMEYTQNVDQARLLNQIKEIAYVK